MLNKNRTPVKKQLSVIYGICNYKEKNCQSINQKHSIAPCCERIQVVFYTQIKYSCLIPGLNIFVNNIFHNLYISETCILYEL